MLSAEVSADGGQAEAAGTMSAATRRGSGRRTPQAHAAYHGGEADGLEEPADMGEALDGPGPVAVTGLAATAGYVLLNTRAGPWLLSLLAAKPLWKQLDPLEILFAWEEKEGRDGGGEDETLLSLVE